MDATRNAIVITDHQLLADFVRPLLEQRGLNVVSVFAFVQPALDYLPGHTIAFAAIDQIMPPVDAPGQNPVYDQNGSAGGVERSVRAIAHMRQHYPHIKTLMLAEDYAVRRWVRAAQAGVNGIASKSYGLTMFTAILDEVLATDTRPIIPTPMLAEFERESRRPIPALRPKEISILNLIQRGFSDKEIARQLNLSHSTIRNYLVVTRQKLGASTRNEACLRALEYGLIDWDW